MLSEWLPCLLLYLSFGKAYTTRSNAGVSMASRLGVFAHVLTTIVGVTNARRDDSVHLGYDIERCFSFVVFALFVVLFAAQNVKRIRHKGLCVPLTVPALFQICGVLVSLAAIIAIYDHHGVFQVFHSLASFYIAVNIDSLMFAALSAYVYIALSALHRLRCQSHTRKNYAISVGVGLAHWVLTNAGVTYLWYTGDSFGGLFANGVAIVCNLFACYRLLSSYLKLSIALGSNLHNTDHRCRIRTYKLMNRWKYFTFAAVFFFSYAIAVGIFFVVRTLRHGHKIVDPAHFGDFEKTVIPLIYVLFLTMLLWFSWQSFGDRESSYFDDHKQQQREKHTKRATGGKRGTDTHAVEMQIAQPSEGSDPFCTVAGAGNARLWPHTSLTAETSYNTRIASSTDFAGGSARPWPPRSHTSETPYGTSGASSTDISDSASSLPMSMGGGVSRRVSASMSFTPSAPLSCTPTEDDMRFMLLDEPCQYTPSASRRSETIAYSNAMMAPKSMSSLSFGDQHQR